MLQGEHSAIFSISIKLPFVTKIIVLSILSGRFSQVLLYISFCDTCMQLLSAILLVYQYVKRGIHQGLVRS